MLQAINLAVFDCLASMLWFAVVAVAECGRVVVDVFNEIRGLFS